jgi:FOG: FHA domain
VSWQPVLSFDGQTHNLKTGTTTVGRDDEADIKVDDRGLSRVHFEIAFDGRMAAIRDLQSTNGTFVDDSRVSELVLRSGSTISAGRTEFNFELMAMAGEPGE